MKKYCCLLIVVFFLFGLKVSAQVTTQKFDPTQFVYWIYIKAEKKVDSELKRPIYVIRILSKTPKSGTMEVFEKELWRSRLAGQQLAVGPFLDYKDATRAITVYDMVKQTKSKLESDKANFKDTTIKSDEFFWYFVKFEISKRTHQYVFERMPARVASGTIKDFLDVFTEGVTHENLNFGPFPTQIEAEESKRLNRLEEK